MEDKKKLKIYYGLLITTLVIIGTSYAWFRLKLTQQNSNIIGTRTCLNTTLNEETSKITLTDAFPISDEDGLKQTPFTFTLKNNCDSYVKIYITIDSKYRESADTAYLKDTFIKTNLSTKGTTEGKSTILGNKTLTELEGTNKGYILQTTGLKANEEKSYDLRVWMDSATSISDGLNKNWEGKIVVVGVASEIPKAPNGWYDAENMTLLASLRENNDLNTPLTTPGKEVSEENEALLASTEDNYGTSYYFRGAVKSNYVEFANKCWRIVRINGDGSIKMTLHNDNTSGASNPCSSANNSDEAAFAHYDGTTYISKFNLNAYGDNAYVGFMYGTVGSSDYSSTHANINKSAILSNLETWYINNLTQHESKLADTIWCNDKSTFTTYTSGSTYGTGLGYGDNQTGYGAHNRIKGGTNASDAASYANPSLICQNDNNGGKLSKFTVSDTINGNGNLTYKIGLLTADEVAFAGAAYAISNKSTYLQENTGDGFWWTMSPAETYAWASIYTFSVDFLGQVYADGYLYNIGLRPAISLVSDITISGGTGTSEDPYVINS